MSRLYLYDKNSNALQVEYDKISDELSRKAGLPWHSYIPGVVKGGSFDQAMQSNRVMVLHDQQDILTALSQAPLAIEQSVTYQKFLDLLNIKALVIIPLTSKDEVHAIITLAAEIDITPETLEVMQRLCRHFSSVLSRIQAEERLISQKKFTDSILNNLPADIAVFDHRHQYLFVNHEAVKDEIMRKWIIGKTDFDYFNLKGLDFGIAAERRKNFERASRGEYVEWVDELKENDAKKYVLRKFFPFLEDEKLKYVFGYGTDVTSLKKAEMMKDEYIHQLEEMAFATSHQVRHSLANIMGMLNVLEMDILDPVELKWIMSNIKPSVNALDNFTRELASNINTYRNKLS